MKTTETTETDTDTDAVAGGLADRARTLQATLVDRLSAVTESGKAALDRRRDGRRRSELLEELGALHFRAAGSDELDQALADRLVAEISALDASDEGSQ